MDEDTLLLSGVPRKEVLETLFLLSSMPCLHEHVDTLLEGRSVVPAAAMRVAKVLAELTSFCSDTSSVRRSSAKTASPS